jgi:hypothetical protein
MSLEQAEVAISVNMSAVPIGVLLGRRAAMDEWSRRLE